VNFGETSSGTRVSTTRCRTNPAYSGAGNDWAYCILSRDINLPITPALPRSCGESVLNRSDARVMLAGFGRHQSGSAGIKRWAWADVRNVRWSSNVLEVGYGSSSTPGTGCPGDSGGPAFVRMDDGTWWTAGIASTLIGACGGTSSWNQYSLVSGAIRWVEQDSGIDITPCHDNAGNWAPTSACRNIYSAAPGSGSGNWSTNPWCQGTPAVQQPSTCGSAPPPPPPTNSVANLFQHCNFSGWQVALAPGDYTTAQLAALGAINNDASSLTLQSGYQAVLYDGDNFTGTAVTLSANTSCLVGNNFNDRLSSLRIRAVSTASCSDGVRNGTESDVDCGGSCQKCTDGRTCGNNADCQSANCSSGVCRAPTASCSDGVKNGSETDVDCGGSCSKCGDGRSCSTNTDCQSANCSSGVCRTNSTGCSGVPQWSTGTYQAGAQVQHNGAKYECKPWPYSGWCGIGGAYEPGVGFAWQDAWIGLGPC
jgi:hypothetical protein